MKKLIEVIQADIDAGVKKDCARCPVASALIRAFGTTQIVVGRNTFVLEAIEEVSLPPEAAEFIDRFDAGRPVSPFTFEVEIPEKAVAS